MARGTGGRERGGGPAGAGALLALSPGRFTAERNALAAKLADAGDARGAAEVRRLRRPIGLAWLLNRVVRDRPDDVAALLSAGDRLRAGQRRALAGQGAAELRAAEEALRTSARALRGRAREVLEEEGRPASPGALARVELLLRVGATAPGETRDALRTGTFSREPEVAAEDLSGLGLVAGTPPPAVTAGGPGAGGAAEPARRARAAPPEPAGRQGAPGAAGGAPAKSSKERRAEQAARERAEREARLRERAIASAQARLEEAEKTARAARQAADAAERSAEAARSRAERAEATVAARRSALEALRRGH